MGRMVSSPFSGAVTMRLPEKDATLASSEPTMEVCIFKYWIDKEKCWKHPEGVRRRDLVELLVGDTPNANLQEG